MKTQVYNNVGTWYGPDQLSSLIKKYTPNVNVLMSASVLLGLSKQLDQVQQNGQYFIPLNINCLSQNFENGSKNDLQNNHWTGLYIVKDSNQTSVTYLDPMGKLINPQLASEIRNKLGTNNIGQPLLNKPVQCVQLDPSGSFIEKGNDADCGPFLVYCVACMTNSKAIRQDIKTLEQSASFGEYLRATFSKETSFDEIYKAGNIVVKAPMKNKAVKEFEQYKLHEFKQWYTPQVVEYLTHLNSQDAFLRYVFFDGNPKDFGSQLESICTIKNFYGKSQKVKGVSFISKEPGLGENHFVFGTFIGNKLIIINPVGETEHTNFYEALNEFKKVYKDVDLFLSNTILQQDSKLTGSGLVSCGPICIELMRYISLLPAEKVLQLTKTGAESKKYGLDYKEINVAAILPDTLSALLNPSSDDDYMTRVIEIRKLHHSILSEYSSLKNLKIEQQNELLEAQCTNHPIQRIVKIHVQDKGAPKTEIIDQYLQQGDNIKNISPAFQKPQKALFSTSSSNFDSEEIGDINEVMSKRFATKPPKKIVSQSKPSESVKDLKEGTTTLPAIKEIRAEVARVLSLEAINSEKVVQLKKIETDQYKPWIRELAYKKSAEEIKQLTVVLNDLGHLITELGELSNRVNDKLKHYTDAAIFYQYVTTILEENKHLHEFPEVLASLKADITAPYKQIDILQKKIISAVGGNTENISSASQEAQLNKKYLTDLRKNTDELLARLEQLKKAEQISSESAIIESSLSVTNANTVAVTERNIFEYIAHQMQRFLGDLYHEAEKKLPNKPEGSEYAVIGLGSMALKQMTPWSDLEFAIIINDHETKEKKQEIITYLRNLTHLVHFKMINLGETVIPTSKYGLDMSHLVKVAVNFDLGGKTPLGRIDQDKQYDLIGTIDWLMNYLRNEGDKSTKGEARDKALPYMLEKVCYVCGNEDLVKSYQGRATVFLKEEDYKGTEGAKEYKGLKQHQARALKVLKEGSQEFAYKDKTFKLLPKWPGDIDKLRPHLTEAEGRLFDVKQEIYRLPDRMVYNLGLYYGIEGDSAWDTVDKLCDKGIINLKAATNLKYAISFATTLRLKTYLHHGRQSEDMSIFSHSLAEEEMTLERKASIFRLSEKDLREEGGLFKYFYAALPLHEKLEGFCYQYKNLSSKEKISFFKKTEFYNDDLTSKGLIYYRLSQYTEAQLKLEAAVNDPENQDNLQIREILGEIYGSFGSGDKAIEQYLYCLEKKKLIYKEEPHPDIAVFFNNLGNAYYSKGNYDQAIDYYQQSLTMDKLTHKEEPHPFVAASLMNLGNAYSSKGNYDQAIEYYRQSLEINKLIYREEPHPFVAASLMNLGNAYSSKGDYDQVIEYYQQGLAMNKLIYKEEPHPNIAQSSNNLGSAYHSKGNYDQAIGYFTQSLKMRKLIYKEEPHPDIAKSLMNLGNVYSSKDNYDQAIGYYKQGLAMNKLIYKEEPHSDIAGSFNNLGSAYHSKGNYDQAIGYYQQGLAMNKLIYKEEPHSDIARSFNNLGNTYHSKGNYDQAIYYYTQSLKMRKLIYKEDPHPDIATSFNNLGNAYKAKDNYDQAIDYYTQSLKMNKLIYKEESHPNIAASFNNLGNASSSKGDYDQAIEYHQRSLEMNKLIYKEEPHSDIAGSFNSLGTAYYHKDDYDQAIYYYTQSLKMRKLIYKEDPHPDIATSFNNLGAAYSSKGNYDQAIDYYTQSLEMNKLIYKEEPHSNIAASFNNLGAAYSSKGNYDQAIYYYTQSLEMNKLIYKEEPHSNIAASFYNLGLAYKAKGNYDQAIDYYQQSLTMDKLIYKENPHPNIAASYNNLGNAYMDKEEYKQAHLYARKALEISLKCQTPQYISMAKTLYNISSLQLGNLALLKDDRAEARECYKKIEVKYEQVEFNSKEFIKLQLKYLNIAYERKNLLVAIYCQKILIKVDPNLQYGNHYHDLACFYACQGNVEEANKAFTNAFIYPNAQVTGGLHAEYAQFLILNQNALSLTVTPLEISKHLYAAIYSNNPGGLQYGKLEQATVCSVLQDLIKKKAAIEVDPKALAYYLLLTHPEYIAANDSVHELIERFIQVCTSSSKETSSNLLFGLLKYSLNNLYELFKESPDENQEALAFLSRYLNKSPQEQGFIEPQLIDNNNYKEEEGRRNEFPIKVEVIGSVSSLQELGNVLVGVQKEKIGTYIIPINSKSYTNELNEEWSKADYWVGLCIEKSQDNTIVYYLDPREKAIDSKIESLVKEQLLIEKILPIIGTNELLKSYLEGGPAKKDFTKVKDGTAENIANLAKEEQFTQILMGYGVFCANQDHPGKALACYNKSVDLYKAYYTHQKHPNLAKVYILSGLAHQNMGKYEMALHYVDKGLGILKEHFGNDEQPIIAQAIGIIGMCQFLMGSNGNEAISGLEKSKELFIKIFGDEFHPQIVGLYHNLALVCNKVGQFQQSIDTLHKTLKILNHLYQEDAHPGIASCYNNIGKNYRELGKLDEAIVFFNKSLDTLKNLHGESDHPNIASILQNKGAVYGEIGEYEKAKDCFNNSFVMFKKVYGSELHPHIYRNLLDQVNLFKRTNEFNELEVKLKHALSIMQQLNIGDIHPDRALAYIHLAEIASKKSDYKQAIMYFKKCLTIQLAISPNKNTDLIANIENEIGVAYADLGDIDQSIKYYKSSLKTLNEVYKVEGHLKIILVTNNLAEAYLKQKDYCQALKYIARSFQMTFRFPENEYSETSRELLMSICHEFEKQYTFDPQRIVNKVLGLTSQGYNFDDAELLYSLALSSNPNDYSEIASLIEEYKFIKLLTPEANEKLVKLLDKTISDLELVNQTSFGLWLAAKNNNIEQVKELAEQDKVDVNVSIQGTTPLLQGVIHQNIYMVALLLDKKADIDKPNQDGASPLYCALGYYNELIKKPIDIRLVEFLLSRGADPNKAISDGDTPMHMAGYRARTDLMKLLLQYRAKINCENDAGKTPLHLVIEDTKNSTSEQRVLAVKYLLSNKAILNEMINSRMVTDFLSKVSNLKDSDTESSINSTILEALTKAQQALDQYKFLPKHDNQSDNEGKTNNLGVHIAKEEESLARQKKDLQIKGIKLEVQEIIIRGEDTKTKIDALRKIEETKYKPLIRELANKTGQEELQFLLKVLSDVGHLTKSIGELSNDIKCYTDAAVLCQYVIAILNKKVNLETKNKLIQEKQIDDPYQQLTEIQRLIFSRISGNKEGLPNVEEEAATNTDILLSLRNRSDEKMQLLENYRQQAKTDSEEELYVNSSKILFEEIAEEMQSFLAKLYKDGEEEIGLAPPCKYAVIGLGSMALKQMTPYSDLEFAIIINEHEIKEETKKAAITYFRNLTHLVHFKMINLGETVIPTSKYGIDMSHLVNVAVNFDLGGKTPLGRIDQDKQYDLIGTIDWLMDYVHNEGDKKTKAEARDKALPYMLEKVCHVYGDEDLVKNYQARISEFLKREYNGNEKQYAGLKQHQARALKVLEEGSQEFAYKDKTFKPLSRWPGDIDKLRFNPFDAQGKIFDVKQEIYRLPDRMVYNLGLYYGIEGDSAWDTIDKLGQNGIISLGAVKHLKSAVTFAITLRLKTYLFHKAQTEDMSLLTSTADTPSELIEQTKLVFHLPAEDLNEQGGLFRYFYTALPLHEKLEEFCDYNNNLATAQREVFFKDKQFYDDGVANKGLINYRLLRFEEALKYQQLELELLRKDSAGQEKLSNLLNNIGRTYCELGNIEKGLEHQLEALDIHKAEVDEDCLDIASAFNNIGLNYCELSNYKKGLEYQLKGQEMLERLVGDKHKNVVINATGIGLTYDDLGDYKNAVTYHEKALKICKDLFGSNKHPLSAVCLNNLALTYEKLGNNKKAIGFYKAALNIMEEVFGHHNKHIIPVLANIGSAYGHLGDYKTGIKYSEEAFKIAQELFSDNHPLIATCCTNLGSLYYQNGENKIGKQFLDKALLIIRQTLGNNNEKTCISLANIGFAYAQAGDYQNELKYLLKAKKIAERLFNKTHPLIIKILSMISKAYYHLSDYSQALDHEKLSLEKKKKLFENNNLDIVKSLANMALIYKGFGNYEEALKHINEAKKTQELDTLNHPHVALIFNIFGEIYNACGQYQLALKSYKEAHANIIKSHLNDSVENVANILSNMGRSHANLGQHQEALEWWQKALHTLQKKLDNHHPNIAKTIGEIGSLYIELKDYDKALESHKQALDMLQEVLPENHKDVIVGLWNVGKSYYARGDKQNALKYQKSALDKHEGLFKMVNNKDYANLLSEISYTYSDLHHYNAALDCSLKANKIMKELAPQGSIEESDYLEQTGLIYYHLNNYLASLEYTTQALEMAQKLITGNDMRIAIKLKNLGASFFGMGEYEKSLTYQEEAIDMFRKIPDVEEIVRAPTLTNAGITHIRLANYSKGLEYLLESLEINQKSCPSNLSDIAHLSGSVGTAYLYMDNCEKALEYYLKAQNLLGILFGAETDNLAVAKNISDIGTVHIKQGEFCKGLEHQMKALNIYKTILGDSHPDIAMCLGNIGHCYSKLGNYQKALECREKALGIFLIIYPKEQFPKGHPHLIFAHKKVEEAREELFNSQKSTANEGCNEASGNEVPPMGDNKENTEDPS